MATGDEFACRCASLLNMYRQDFAASPAMFNDDLDDDRVLAQVQETLPCFENVSGMKLLLRMCTTSLFHNRSTVESFSANHIAQTIPFFRDAVRIKQASDMTHIKYAWDSDYNATGIPPHIKELVQLEVLRSRSDTIMKDVTKSVMTSLQKYFEEKQIGQDLTAGQVQ
jgi:hypothetical protein